MPSVADHQFEFVAALLAATPAAPPAGLLGRGEESPVRRFGVYRNNVYAGLIETLKAAYPVVHRHVGDEFFRAMARAYVTRELPESPVLIHYGGSFPSFIETFEPAASLPWLADVARIEWAWQQAYHAPDRTPLDAGQLADMPAARLPHIRFDLHPSLRLIASAWPVHDIWETNRTDETVRPIDPYGGGQDVLLVRPDLEVFVRRLPRGARHFLEALAAGETVAIAAESAMQREPAFDLGGNLRGMLTIGAFAGFHSSETETT